MKVVHLIDHMGLGGSQALLVDLLETRSPGVDADVVTLNDGILPEWDHRLREAGVRPEAVDLRRGGPVALARLRSLLAERRPDVLHTHLDVSNCLGALYTLALRRSRPRLVLTLENDPFLHYALPLRLALRALVPRADACVVISKSLRERAGPLLKRARSLDVIAPGIDLDRFKPDAADREEAARLRQGATCVVGSVGRLTRQKGFDVLIDAMPELLSADPQMRVLIVGEGRERSALEARARRHGVEHALVMPGYMADPRVAFAAMDVFVAPSRHEGFGLVFLEAMAMGVPVVGTRVTGSVDAVEDGRTGVLAPPEDSRALARTILELLADPDRRRELVTTATHWVREHASRRRVTERTEALYTELCEGLPRRRVG